MREIIGGISKAYPEYPEYVESHNILLNDIFDFFLSKLDQAVKERDEEIVRKIEDALGRLEAMIEYKELK